MSEKSLDLEVKPQTATTTTAGITTGLHSKVNMFTFYISKGATNVLNIFEIIGVLHYLRTD